ncbi:4-alpha-glucanotransferase [Slackia heliotrinireducens]|nr:4-alpha-glucanotransferase [Slackia heliotrinireducens]
MGVSNMQACHNSRDVAYRLPYGAVQQGESVALSIDLWDAQGAIVRLRTWTAESGERIYPMDAVVELHGAVRHKVELAFDGAGIVWYHFIIQMADGRVLRYGACDGKTGGEGRLYDWEPPSFQLTVCDPNGIAPSRDEDDLRRSQSMLGPVADFLLGRISAPELAEMIEALRENYPDETFRHALAFLEGMDDDRLLGLFSGLPESELTLNDGGPLVLDDHHAGIAKGRLWCASLLQMLSPAGTRQTESCPVVHTDRDCQAIFDNARDLRETLPLFMDGTFSCFAANEDVLGFWRRGADGTSACVLVNGSLQNAHDVFVPMTGEAVSEVIGGYDVPVCDASELDGRVDAPPKAQRYARVRLSQIGSAVVYFHPTQRLQLPMDAGLGVLAHITSLPVSKNPNAPEASDKADAGRTAPAASEKAEAERDPSGVPDKNPGTLGAPAREFVDWLAQAGARYWQVLPVNPTDEYGSPYAGISAFAGNTRLLERPSAPDTGDAADRDPDAYRRFCTREADWLEPYAAFMAIRQKLAATSDVEPLPWQDWPNAYRSFDPSVIQADPELREHAERCRRAQFEFEQQWDDLRRYANARGVLIVGDMPIYVSADSADVWANPELFQLEPDGRPAAVAGCPPDAFAEEGQLWGNPVYNWDALRESGYDWWLRRLQRAFRLYDFVRLDHFIGFSRYYRIPKGKPATEGNYCPGPGADLFRTAYEQFGPLPVIAEDLGSITPAVRALAAACGFPGMDVVQFADGNDPLSGWRPRPAKVAYTGTHDNQTLVGYVRKRYPDLDCQAAVDRLMRDVVTCEAPVAVLPLQDLMGLDDDARMNTPGTSQGNWTWQADRQALRQTGATLHALVDMRNASLEA